MNVLYNEKISMWDVDDTLVLWSDDEEPTKNTPKIIFHDPGLEKMVEARMHLNHIKLLKEQKARGHTIIVWSQGGARYAEAVVKALGLEQYVHLVMTKPSFIVDDLDPIHWLPATFYMKPEKRYKPCL